MKICSNCVQEKPLVEFNLRSKNSDARQSMCKVCESEKARERYLGKRKERIKKQRIVNISNKYGVTIQDYNEMFESQNGCCAICDSHEIGRKGAKYFNIDHCHNSGKVRGLLCHNCNIILGKIDDSKDWLNRAIEYLT
jgi:hypothetical protein